MSDLEGGARTPEPAVFVLSTTTVPWYAPKCHRSEPGLDRRGHRDRVVVGVEDVGLAFSPGHVGRFLEHLVAGLAEGRHLGLDVIDVYEELEARSRADGDPQLCLRPAGIGDAE